LPPLVPPEVVPPEAAAQLVARSARLEMEAEMKIVFLRCALSMIFTDFPANEDG
jgi:hypothetical protein